MLHRRRAGRRRGASCPCRASAARGAGAGWPRCRAGRAARAGPAQGRRSRCRAWRSRSAGRGPPPRRSARGHRPRRPAPAQLASRNPILRPAHSRGRLSRPAWGPAAKLAPPAGRSAAGCPGPPRSGRRRTSRRCGSARRPAPAPRRTGQGRRGGQQVVHLGPPEVQAQVGQHRRRPPGRRRRRRPPPGSPPA